MIAKQKNILLAEDDEDDSFFFKDAVDEIKPEIHLHQVYNGNELWGYLQDHESFLPDIIFLDTHMPGPTGVECLEKIRSSRKYKEIPVIMYSDSVADNDVDASYRYGANFYIKKPNEFVKLKKMIHDILDMDWQQHLPRTNREHFLIQ